MISFKYDLTNMTKEKWNDEMKQLKNNNIKIHCFICNSNTAKLFKIPLLGDNIITINNSVPDNIIYLNRRCD